MIREFLPWQHMLTYVEAILRVYNLHGRRDNIYKARIKILVKALGVEEFARQVEAEWDAARRIGPATLTEEELARVVAHFAPPAVREARRRDPDTSRRSPTAARSRRWVERNVTPHRVPGYARGHALAEEDGRARRATSPTEQMDFVADAGRALQLRRASRLARAEPDPRRREDSATCFALWHEARRWGSPRRTSAC